MSTVVVASARIVGDDLITITHDAESGLVSIRWPRQPTPTTSDRLPVVANKVMAVLAEAIAKLGQLRSGEL